MSDDIQAVLDAYAAAVYAKDVEAFTGLYTEDVLVFDAWMEFEAKGAQSQRDMAAGWFDMVGDDKVVVEYEDVVSAVDGDVAWAHAAVTFAGESADGERVRQQTNRFSYGLKKIDGQWKIAHQHSSLPVDFATHMAISNR